MVKLAALRRNHAQMSVVFCVKTRSSRQGRVRPMHIFSSYERPHLTIIPIIEYTLFILTVRYKKE
jgi:hypothetical protein